MYTANFKTLGRICVNLTLSELHDAIDKALDDMGDCPQTVIRITKHILPNNPNELDRVIREC